MDFGLQNGAQGASLGALLVALAPPWVAKGGSQGVLFRSKRVPSPLRIGPSVLLGPPGVIVEPPGVISEWKIMKNCGNLKQNRSEIHPK